MTLEIVENQEQVQAEETHEMAGGIPGETGAIISGLLFNHVYPRRLGRVFNSQTDFEIPGIVGKKQPDVSFVSLQRLKANTFDAVPVAPDLAVEVVSKTDHTYDTEDKVFEYIKAGVRLVWVVRPKHKLVEIYRQGADKPVLLGVNDELTGGEVLPDFKVKVAEIFEQLSLDEH